MKLPHVGAGITGGVVGIVEGSDVFAPNHHLARFAAAVGVEEYVACAGERLRFGRQVELRPVAGHILAFVPELNVALHIDELLGLVVLELVGGQLLGAAPHLDIAAHYPDAILLQVGHVSGEVGGLRVRGRGRKHRSRRKLQDVPATSPL